MLLPSQPAWANAPFLSPMASASPFLAPAKAFRFKAHMAPNNIVVLQWIAAPKYHLYRNRITVHLTPSSAQLGPYTLPPGKPMHIPGVGTL
ncbi:thiol:disulfide interchange protein, partial [Acidithiobacillus ferridurans]|nr:thiol:disulfide interchange protein [Acidithiobacillus ferridurans]